MSTYDYVNYGNANQDDCDYDPYGDTGVLSRGGSNIPPTAQLSYETVEMTEPFRELLRLNTGDRFRIFNNSCLVMGRATGIVHIFVDNNPSVSNQHVQINCIGGVCSVVDLHSRNGTFVNDRRLIPGVAVIMNSGEYLTLGNEIFQFIQY